MSAGTCTIDFITRIDPAPEGHVLNCYGGLRAVLPADHPDHDFLLSAAQSSHAHHFLVGVAVDSRDVVIDLRNAFKSRVWWVRQYPEVPTHLEVALLGCSPVCYLRYDHPEFERIRLALETAHTAGDSVWCATYWEPEEVKTPDETWIGSRLMDVRPVRPEMEWAPGKDKPAQGAAQAPGIVTTKGEDVPRETADLGS